MNDLERARDLIPGYLKNSLSSHDSVWMTRFIGQLQSNDLETWRQLDAEMQWIEKSQAQMQQAIPGFDTDAGWKKRRLQLEQRPVQSMVVSKWRLLKTFWQKPMVGVLASAMIVAQMGLLGALFKNLRHVLPDENAVTPASGSKQVADSAVFAVVFKNSATARQIRELLDSQQAEITGGPGAIGIWLISVPKANLTSAAKALSDSQIVESVTPQ